MSKQRWLAVCVAAAAMNMAGCEDKINESSFSQIQPGMDVFTVEKMLGGKGEIETASGMSISGAGIASGSTSSQTTLVWKKNGKQISVVADKGKVVSKGKDGF